MAKSDQQHITQHKRFVLLAHPNFCSAKTSFMPGTLDEVEVIMSNINGSGNFYQSDVDKIEAIMKEYGLEDRLDIIESLYDLLMKKRYFSGAKSLARKYGL